MAPPDPREARPHALQDAASGRDVDALASGAAVSLFGRAAGRGAHTVGLVLVARLLGPTSFGLFAIGWTLLKIGTLIGALGLDKGVIRFGVQARDLNTPTLKRALGNALGLALASGLLWCVAQVALSGPLERSVFDKPGLGVVLRWLGPAVALAIVLRVLAAATRISRRVHYGVIAEEIVQPVGFLALVLVSFWVAPTLQGPVTAAAISYAVAVLAGVVYLWRLYPGAMPPVPGPGARRLLAFSVVSSLGGVFTVLVIRVDRLFVGYFLPSEALGVYEAAAQLAGLFSLILGSFAPIFAPLIVDCHREGATDRLRELYRISTKWAAGLALPAFVVVVLFPREVMVTIFDARYESGWLPLVILCSGQMVNAVTGAVGLLLIMTDHHRPWFIVSGLALALDLALNLLLVPRFGLQGAATATALTLALLFGSGLIVMNRLVGIFPYDRRFLRLLAAGGVAAVAGLLIRQWGPEPAALRLAAGTAAVAAAFLGTFLTQPLAAEERRLLEVARRRLGRTGRE